MSDDHRRAAELIEIYNAEISKNQLFVYKPYPKQEKFHHTTARERCFMASNQSGKTYSGGAEVAYHLINKYPKWWQGRRFEGGIKAWASGVTSLSTRDTVQRILLGMPEVIGTGMIPGNKIHNAIKAATGASNLYDYVEVICDLPHTHQQGKSYVYFKSYEQGRMKWQGESIELVWFDEEPPLEIYTEGLTRTNARDGFVFLTFTPLLGMSRVVRRFLMEPSESRVTIQMDISDALHYSEAQRKEIIASYPEHEREARAHGRPVLGSGAVYPVLEDGIKIDPFEIPMHWPRIAAIDLGWDHPTAVVWIAHDKDTDIVYLYDCYRESRKIISTHASAIRNRGAWIPLAWPHDGMDTDPRSGETIIGLYKREGVRALSGHARYPDTRGNSLEASVADVLDRMETGRFKVFRHLSDWWGEFRMYHREEGKIVKMDDDLMSATRYAIMQLRSARLPPDYQGETARYSRYSRNQRSFMSS